MLRIESQNSDQNRLQRYITPLGAWALSLGCAVGWGSVVMPGTTFLPAAGPLGTALGIFVGMVVMFIIGVNYHYLMNKYPEDGGTMTYSIREFGYDHGFLSAWFLLLVYIAIAWANATAIVLIARHLFGSTFQWGFHYVVAGYHVYLGEILLTEAAIVGCGLICMLFKKFALWLQILMAIILFGCVVACACLVIPGHVTAPAFSPRGSSNLSQIMRIAALTPWAFVGFESISNSTNEFKFPTKRSVWIFIIALITGGICYISLTYIAAAVVPAGYANWVEYLKDLGNLSGFAGLPTFNAVNTVMGSSGVSLLGAAVFAGIITGLIGNYIAASRLIYSMSTEDILPEWFGKLDQHGTPVNAFLALILGSLFVPFAGRAAIVWIVDVNTIGALISYAYTSAAAYKLAQKQKKPLFQATGLIGLVSSFVFFIYFMLPNLASSSALSAESYLILIFWSLLGFVYFRIVFTWDKKNRFGRSTIAWVSLLSLIFFTSMVWFRSATQQRTQAVFTELNNRHVEELRSHGIVIDQTEIVENQLDLDTKMLEIEGYMELHGYIQMFIIISSLLIMFSIYHFMTDRNQRMEMAKIAAEQSNRAKSTFLSNMSHDIRTPMNAIIGYTDLAKKEKDLSPKVQGYLNKIETSSKHLLDLINDVLEMSRIENGKMELAPIKSDIVKVMDDVKDLFMTQMNEKGLTYIVESKVTHKTVLCDTKRLNRVLLNLISNAFKFTPAGGEIQVTLQEIEYTNKAGIYEIRVKDTGMGMSPEFAATVFDAYSREKRAENIQGTGLGMAITKSIVDLMKGSIRVKSELGKGTEFIIRLVLPLEKEDPVVEETSKAKPEAIDFSGVRLLLVEDNMINRELATLILEGSGFVLDTAENGKEAVDKVASSTPGHYKAVLMDIQMPIMDGYEATKAIRALGNKDLSSIPIVAMTANAFAEDIQTAKNAGMNSYIIKPIDVSQMMSTLAKILRK